MGERVGVEVEVLDELRVVEAECVKVVVCVSRKVTVAVTDGVME